MFRLRYSVSKAVLTCPETVEAGHDPALARPNGSGPGAPPGDLPLPLEPTGAGAPVAPFEYEALFNALGSVFPIGIFRTDEAGLLTHVDAQLLQICGMQRVKGTRPTALPSISRATPVGRKTPIGAMSRML